ncbi:MAG: ABC transporter permease [Thiolinea sp.]
MDALIDAASQALYLLFSGDRALWEIVAISLRVSLTALVIAVPLAVLLAFALAYGTFPGRRFLIAMFSTLLSVPTVVIGLTLYLILSRQGPLGEWRLLFSQTAMVLGQIVLAFPMLVSLGHSALQAADRRAWETAPYPGASATACPAQTHS